MKPLRLALAQLVVPYLPPLPAHFVREFIYPPSLGVRDDYQFIVHAQTGSLLRHTTRDMYGWKFGTCGYFNFRNWALAIALCKPGDTIVEVGANVGTETIGFSDIVGREGKVFAFEPLPTNVAALEASLALNSICNVTVKPIALGETAGIVRFALPSSTNSGIGQVVRDGVTADQVIEVECGLLDSYADEIGPSPLLCMDAEDSERFILRGAQNYIRRYRPAIIVEARRKIQKSLYSEVEQLGYKAFNIGLVRLTEVTTVGETTSDWLCLHPDDLGRVARANRLLNLSALMPCLPGINPITRRLGL